MGSISGSPCPSLKDIFLADGLYEHNLIDFVIPVAGSAGARNGSDTDGAEISYSIPGDRDAWQGNPLHQGDKNGPVVGSSNGMCDLLPPDGGASQCLTIFDFEEHGTLVFSSLWPNDITTLGELIIVGGTKCFEDAVGTVTVEVTDEAYEHFLYKLDSSADEKECDEGTALFDLFDMSSGQPTLFQVRDNNSSLSILSDISSGPSAADRGLWHEGYLLPNVTGVANASESAVGLASGACTWLDANLCWGLETFQFNDSVGKIALAANFARDSPESTFNILGGTQCFVGEKGSISMSRDEAGVIKSVLDPVVRRADCDDQGLLFFGDNASLDEVLAEGLYELRENVSIVSASGGVGTGSEIGDTTLWVGNPLSPEDDGGEIGRSSGMCTLLPGGNALSICSVRLEFDEGKGLGGGGSITFMGLLPSREGAQGLMAVVAGTGCFPNPTVRTLQYTREPNGFMKMKSLADVSSSPSSGASRKVTAVATVAASLLAGSISLASSWWPATCNTVNGAV